MNNSQHDSEEGNDNDNHNTVNSSSSMMMINKSNQIIMNERTKNSYISMLSSCDDQPRENVKGPQLKIRVKVIEENI